jgi:hypothetical protein
MHNGHLLDLKMMMAFSTEKASEGSPSMLHYLIFTGSPNVAWRLYVSEEGIFFVTHSATHCVVISPRKALVNAPR